MFAAAARTPDARRFLSWSRFPYVTIETDADAHPAAYVVHFRDARYLSREGILGPTVRLDHALRPLVGPD